MFDKNTIKLTRKVMPQDRRDYKLARFITPEQRELAATITQKVWSTTKILDQGDTPHCVGYAWAGFGISEPVEDKDWDNDTGEKIYYAAKVIDGEPGQEDGTDTRSGVKAFMKFGFLQDNTYAFTYSIDDIIVWIKTCGPVVVGTNWYDNMFYPNSKGVVTIGGSVAGGHEYMIVGCDDATKRFLCTNSWGDSFAIGGQFYISYSDMAKLLSPSEQGDAVTTLEVAEPIPPEPEPTPTPTPTPIPDNWFEVIVELLKKIIALLEKLIGSPKKGE